jgi:hypothetical protein
MNHAKRFAKDLTRERFLEAPKKKFNRRLYEEDLEGAWIAGFTTLCEMILKRHKEEPYDDVDIFLGDIHLLVTENFNYFSQKLAIGAQQHVRIKVEDFLRPIDKDTSVDYQLDN